jgi:Protein of unknown function (DUF998)
MNFRTTHKRRPDHARHRVRVTAPASTSGRGNDRRPRVPGVNEQQAPDIGPLGVRASVLERAAALSGLIAFVTFHVGWIAGDFAQRPAFSPARADISHLGAMTAKSPWLHNQVASNLTGLLIVALGVGLWLALRPSRLGRLGAATLAAMGVCLFLDGFLRLDCQPIDAGCSNDSWHSHAHKINSGILAGFSFVSVLLLALAFRRLPRWRDSCSRYSPRFPPASSRASPSRHSVRARLSAPPTASRWPPSRSSPSDCSSTPTKHKRRSRNDLGPPPRNVIRSIRVLRAFGFAGLVSLAEPGR